MRARTLVGLNLRRLRVSKEMSQEAVGLLANREPSYVGRIERGEENVTVDTLEHFAKALKAEMAEFFVALEPEWRKPRSFAPGRKPSKRRA